MASNITPAQKAFVDAIEKKVNEQLGSQLDGTFQMVNYPSGFNYGITYGNNAYYNKATLQDIDTLLGTSSSGGLELTGGGFSGYYLRLLGTDPNTGVTFSFSSADEEIINEQDTASQSQIASVLTEFENAGGTYSDPLPKIGGKLQDVINQLTKEYGSLDKIPDTLNSLRNAIVTYKSQAADSYALHNKFYSANNYLNAAKEHAKNPNAENGGMQVDKTSFYVGYTPEKLPTTNQLLGWLKQESNKITVNISVSHFDSTATQFSIDGGIGGTIPIADLFNIKIGASASYNLSKYTSSSSSMTMSITYSGLANFSSSPSRVSNDDTEGWYANDILSEIVKNTGKDATGYKLQGSEYNIADTFGVGKKFSRLKTFVISQQPQISITFKGADTSKIVQDFQQNASVSVNLFGFIPIGHVSESYKVHKVDTNSQAGSVTLTLGGPAVSGTIPLQQQVAYVIGGVASYPPNKI